MIVVLLIFTFLLLCVVAMLLEKNKQLKNEHFKTINRLQLTVNSLVLKQQELNDKLFINQVFDANFNNDFKKIGNQIVTLQETFLEIVSNKK